MTGPLPARLRGPVATANYGGWSTPRILHTPFPAGLADISGAHSWSYSIQGLQRFDIAERWTVRTVTGEVRRIADQPDLRRKLLRGDVPLHGRLILVKVRPHGKEILPTKAKRSGVVRLSMAPTDLQGDACWWWLSDPLAGVAMGGPFPADIVEAREIVPNGVRDDLRPVRLVTGRVVDPRTEDLLVAIREERARIDGDNDLPRWQRDGWADQLRLTGSVVASGIRSRLDRDTLRKSVPDEVLFLDNECVSLMTRHPERPGPHFNLAVAGAVTARIRLAVAQAVGGIQDQGGDWLHVAVDAVLAAVTHDDEPEVVPCPGGRHRSHGRTGILALPVDVVREVLDATGAPWKLKTGFDRPMIGYVSGTYKTALVDPVTGEGEATEAMLGGVYLDPTGTNHRTPDGRFRWAVDAHLAVAKAGTSWSGKGPFPNIALPDWADHLAIRPGVASTPEIVSRLQKVFPEVTIRPFAPFWMAVVDPVRTRAVPVSLDVGLPPERWLHADWRDQRDGSPVTVSVGCSEGSDTVQGRSIREVLWAWCLSQDATVVPVCDLDHVLKAGTCVPTPVRSRQDLFEPTGKEGDDLLSLMTDPLAAKDDQLNIYRRADTWVPIWEVAKSLRAAELVRRTGLAERTARRIIRGGRPSAETAALVSAALEGTGPLPPRSCARVGCASIIRDRQTYCSDRCRKSSDRARDRLALHRRGAKRCRKCEGIRYGEQSGPCPSCGGRAVAQVTTKECPNCGVDRVGDIEGLCPFCSVKAVE